MKKTLAAVLLTAGILLAATLPQAESAMPVGKYKCMNCGIVVQTKYNVKTNTIPMPSKEGCKKSITGEHNWRAMGGFVR